MLPLLEISEISTQMLLVTSGLLLILLYFYLTKDYNAVKKMGLSGPKQIAGTGTLYKLWKKPPHMIDFEEHRKYGRFFGTFEGRNLALRISDLEIAKQILIEQDDTFIPCKSLVASHRCQLSQSDEKTRQLKRNILKEACTTEKIQKLRLPIQTCCNRLVNSLRITIEKNNVVDLRIPVSHFVAELMAATILGVRLESGDCNEIVHLVKKISSPRVPISTPILAFLPSIIGKLFPSRYQSSAIKTLREMIKERIESAKKVTEMSSILRFFTDNIKRQTEDGSGDKDEATLINDEFLVEYVLELLLSGQEVLSSAVLQALYQLALNVNWQDALVEEINRYDKEEKSILQLMKMPVLNAVIMETLRIGPPVTRFERQTVNATKIDGVDIPPGTITSLSLYTIFQDKLNYPAPNIFDPTRFERKYWKNNPDISYCPFGAGKYSCPAQNLALIYLRACIIQLGQEFQLETCGLTQIPLEGSLLQTVFTPNNGVWLKLKNRV